MRKNSTLKQVGEAEHNLTVNPDPGAAMQNREGTQGSKLLPEEQRV